MGRATSAGASALTSLGLCLRQAREAQGLAPETLSARLRIGVEQLIALENGDRERLPEPVFVLAQARRVASALCLDLEPQLAILRRSGELQRLPRAVDGRDPVAAHAAAERGSPPPAGRRSAEAGRQTRRSLALMPILLGSGALLVLVSALVWWRSRPVSPSLAPAAAGSGLRPMRPSPPVAPAVATAAVGVRPTTAPAVPRSAAVPAVPRPAAAPAAPRPSLLLNSSRPSWVKVRSQAGEVLFEGMLSSPRSFPLGSGLNVLAGRPDLVSSRIGAAPARPLGLISDVRWRAFRAAP